MQIFVSSESLLPTYQKAMSLYLGKEFAQRSMGMNFVTPAQDSEQHSRRRELLEVEQKAQQKQLLNELSEQKFADYVEQQLIDQVRSAMNQQLDSPEFVYQQLLKIDNAAPDMLDLLSVRAASIKRITPLAASLTWLAEDLVKLVNKPQYRKRSDVQVHDPKLAVSYIGLDNLKLVLPTFVLKHWLPHSTAPFTLMKRKIWNDSIALSLASQALANQQGGHEFAVFCAGMLSQIGILAITRCFIQQFNDIHQTQLKQAYADKDKRLHNVLVKLEPSAELLLYFLMERSYPISAQLVEQMNFKYLPLTEPMFDLAYTTDINKLHPIAKTLVQAKAYVDFRSLAKEGLIDNDEAKRLFAGVKLSSAQINQLKKTDIDHLKLQFN